jgi:hypothetical protein
VQNFLCRRHNVSRRGTSRFSFDDVFGELAVPHLIRAHNGRRLSNLQLLEGAFNNEKRQKLPADWLAGRYPKATERANYCSLHDLGEVPAGITAFEEFYKARRTRLFDKITDVINVSQAKPMGSHIEVSAA